MKKLMIAAAAAAMIGGAQATDLAYDYSASLKTTVGKGGSTTTTTVYLGQNQAETTFWYEDATIQPNGDPEQDIYKLVAYKDANNRTAYKQVFVNGTEGTDPFDVTDLKTKSGWFADFDADGDGNPDYIAVVSYTANKYGYIGKLNSNFNALTDAEKKVFGDALKGTYDKKSANKWCATFKYKDLVQCYRVAGTKKYSGRVTVQDCCTDVYQNDDVEIAFDLFNRFGAITLEKATKIEVCGYAHSTTAAGTYCDGLTSDQFTLAGQGTWNAKLVTDSNKDAVAGISSVSGYIVGVLEDPDCESCCQANVLATAWTCDGTENDNNNILTAAYGTWSLKFNKKASTID